MKDDVLLIAVLLLALAGYGLTAFAVMRIVRERDQLGSALARTLNPLARNGEPEEETTAALRKASTAIEVWLRRSYRPMLAGMASASAAVLLLGYLVISRL